MTLRSLAQQILLQFCFLCFSLVAAHATNAPSFVDAGVYQNLTAAATAIGSKPATLSISGTMTVSENLTVPESLSLAIARGGGISIAPGKTLTIKSPFETGRYRVFQGQGTVKFEPGSVTDVYPEWWGAIGNGTTDCTSAIQKAHDAIDAHRGVVSLGVGTYLIKSTISLKASMRGVGSADNESRISTPPDFSMPALKITGAAYRRWYLEKLSISGTGRTPGSIGIMADDPSYHFCLRDLFVSGFDTGYSLFGWIAEVSNIWAFGNRIGVHVSQFNGNRLQAFCENNYIGLDFDSGSATTISGVYEANEYAGIRIRSATGVTLQDVYMEVGMKAQSQQQKYNILAGYDHTSKADVKKLNIIGGTYSCLDRDNGILRFDKADINILGANLQSNLETTENTRIGTFSGTLVNAYADANLENIQDNSKSFVPDYNVFENPYPITFKGFKPEVRVNAAVEIEKTNTYGGGGIRISAIPPFKSPLVYLNLDDKYLSWARGKTIRYGFWVYVPATPASGTFTAPASYPRLIVQARTGNRYSGSYNHSRIYKNDTWNWFSGTVIVPADAEQLHIFASLAPADKTVGSDTYCIISGITLSDTTDPSRLMRGNTTPRQLDGVAITKASAMPTSGYFSRGDVVFSTSGHLKPNGWRRLTDGYSHVLNTDWTEF
jgi:Pectate lyase superfamily protein